MDFTQAFHNINYIYSIMGMRVIKRRDFVYKDHRITLYYITLPEDNTHIMRLLIRTGKDILYIPFYLIEKNDGYAVINPYFPSQAYDVLKRSLFYIDQYSPTPLFEQIREKVENDSIDDYSISSISEFDGNIKNSTINTNPEDYVYFHYLRSSDRVGEVIQNRIKSFYPEPEQLIRRLKRIRKTLVFTNRYEKRQNLILVLNNEEKNSIIL